MASPVDIVGNHLGKLKAPSVWGPIRNNHLLPLSHLGSAFSEWKDIGLKCFCIFSLIRLSIYFLLSATTCLGKMLNSITSTQKSLILFLYNSLNSPQKIRLFWDRELDIDLTDDYWEESLKRANSSLYHQIWSNHEIYPSLNPTCSSCSHSPADLTRTSCSCSALQNYWSAFSKTLSGVLGVLIYPSSLIGIFSVPNNLQLM